LGSGIPRWFGLISFSIYLIHIPAIPLCDILKQLIFRLHLPHAQLLASAMRASLPIGIAFLTYTLIEKPCQKLLTQDLTRLRQSPRRDPVWMQVVRRP